MVLKHQPRAPLSKAEENQQMKANMDLFFATKIQQDGPGPETHKLLREGSVDRAALNDHLSRLMPMASRLMNAANHQSRIVHICIQ